LIDQLRALPPADAPLFIAVDQEGGRVARLRSPVLSLPPMRALAELEDPSLIRDAATLLGRQLQTLGFNLDFAPVLDVDTNPDNPAIGDRSFGRDPAAVVKHARAFAAGLAAGGVAACGKHFPGHGDTLLDSHFDLPRVSHPRERLERIELAPFRALQGELPCIMTAHVLFDALDPDRPATLSRPILQGLLRGELGFRGLIWSDDLEMKAVSDRYGVAEAACLAIEAGCDSVLICSKPEEALAAQRALLLRAERDRSFAARLHDAASRSLALRRTIPPFTRSGGSIEQALSALQPEAIEARIRAARPIA
ncbi:MAG TPA: beta-N-acetylhexosaminidase, partial [Polyangiales bacterium]